MRALVALRRAAALIENYPSILLATVLLSGMQLLGTLLAVSHPLLYIPGVIIAISGSPYLVAGLYGTIRAANNGDPISIRTFIDTANKNYLRLFIGRIITGLIELAAFVTVLGVVSYGGISSVQVDLHDLANASVQVPPPSVIAGLTTFTVIALLAPLIPLVFIQFYDVIIVDKDVIIPDAFTASIEYVWNHATSVGVYTAIRASLLGLVSVPSKLLRSIALASILTSSLGIPGLEQYVLISADSPLALVLLLSTAFVLGTVSETIKRTYHYIYYQMLADS